MLRRAAALIGVSFVGGYCADMTINDDWDSLTDMFRTKISAEERLKNPRKKLVILGTLFLRSRVLRFAIHKYNDRYRMGGTEPCAKASL